MKNSNFKKVLALVLSLAMVLSVCLTGFAVSAETDEAVDLSYYLLNDGTKTRIYKADGSITNNWSNGSSQVAVKHNGRDVLRIAPQREGKTHLSFNTTPDSTVDYSAVNTLSYYVKNETGAPLKLRYQYYEDNGTQGYFNGYVYLVAADEAEILPYLTDDKGNIALPAKFEGYVVYDLSASANYGNVSINLGDGNWDDTNPTVDYIKNTKKFAGLSMFVDVTADMLTKAWYLDDIAISTKTVEELAKFLTNSKTASWNFNTASAGGYGKDDAINFWSVSHDVWDLENVNGPANLVEFGTLEGIGSQFPRIASGGGHDGALGLNDAFVESIGTDLPYALENAKAIKISVENKGAINLAFRVAGSGNYLFGSYILVADDGAVSTSAKFPTNFSGDAYFIFDDMAVSTGWSSTPTYTWADFIKSRTGDFNMNVYTNSGAAGDVLTVGGFSFVYDLTEITALTTNPVVVDGSKVSKRGANSTVGTYDGNFDLTYGDKLVFKRIEGNTTARQWFYINNDCAKIAISDPENVNALSFRAYLPDVGSNYSVQMALSTWDMHYYRGEITAVNYDGSVYTAAAVTTGCNKITLPSGFDGIIIMEVKTATMTTSYNSAEKTYTGFANYYANATFSGVQPRISRTDSALIDYLELDNLSLVYQDIEGYINDFKAGKLIAEIAENVAERAAESEAAAKEELLTGTHVVNTFTGTDGNTMSCYTGNGKNRMDVSYVSESAQMVYNGVNANTDEARVTMAVKQGTLDLSKAVGFTYDVNITNPGSFAASWTHQGPAQQYGLTDPMVYFVDKTSGVVVDMGNAFNINKLPDKTAANGTVVVLFNPEMAIKATWGGAGEWTWEEFVASKNGTITALAFWMGTNPAYTTVEEEVTDETTGETTTVTTKVLTDACANFKAQIDNLAFIYENNEVLDYIDENGTNDVRYNAANDLSKVSVPYSSYGIYETSIVALDEAPNGHAIFFDRVKDTYTVEETDAETGETTTVEKNPGSTTHVFKLANSKLTQEKMAAMEAVSFWVKVPEGTTKTFQPEFNSDGNYYKGVYIVVDQNTGEVTYHDYKVNGASITLEGGFTGYVILPLKYAQFTKSWSHSTEKFTPYATLMQTSNLNQFVFYWSNAHQDWYMGEIKMIENLKSYLEGLGIEEVSGDINNDDEVDVRDLIRLKKFNADPYTTTVGYQNLDVDANGVVDTAAELVASRKQNIGAEYKAPEIDASLVKYPETMVGLYHHCYGEWDSKYADIAAEKDIVNMYSTTDLYTLAQLKENGGFAWFYLSEYYNSEPVFGTKDGGYDRAATEINEAYKAALDEKVQQLKKLGLWNTVVGFTDEEILIGDQVSGMTQAQFAIWTKYLSETYGKRFNACLSTYEVAGSTATNTTAANAETYAYVTDIGYDWYTGTLEQHKTMLSNLMTNTGNRSDVKYWFYPTAYTPDSTSAKDLVSPARDDATIAAQIEIFAAMADEVPAGQLGGYYFYTWRDWGNSWGLESLIEDYDYTATADALVALASKYVK